MYIPMIEIVIGNKMRKIWQSRNFITHLFLSLPLDNAVLRHGEGRVQEEIHLGSEE
jgi:hypothetical protein